MTEARDIYQDHLDRVSRALWDRDFETILDIHRYPHVIRFSDAHRSYDSREDLMELVTRFRSHLDGLGATGYHRVCERASYDPLNHDRINGAHWTYILRGGNYLTEPYPCEMVITREAGVWYVTDLVVPALKHGIPTPDERPMGPAGVLQ